MSGAGYWAFCATALDKGKTPANDNNLTLFKIKISFLKDQATFKAYIKDFMKKVIEHMQKQGKSAEQVDAFKKKIQSWVVSLLAKDRFKTLAFFIGIFLKFYF